MKKLHRILRRTSAILLGLVFFASGIVKLVDPVGAGLVMSEYFNFFNVGFLEPLSKIAGTAMAFFETVIGAGLMSGVWRKFFSIVTMLITAFFTLLTLILYIKNPVMDCGCFGEAVHLTHLQTFLKNIVLCALCVIAFAPFKDFGPVRRIKYYAFGSVIVLLAFLGVVSWRNIPPVDFTDYKAGAELYASAMLSHDEMDADSDGNPILSILDSGGNYRDELAIEGQVMVFSVYDLNSFEAWHEMGARMESARFADMTPLLLVSGTPEMLADALQMQMSEWEAESIMESAYFADYKTLLTMNRSNGGATYVADGVIVTKWSQLNYPDDADELEKISEMNPIEVMLKRSNRGQAFLEGIALYSLVVMLML